MVIPMEKHPWREPSSGFPLTSDDGQKLRVSGKVYAAS